jgi:hypothetical protein
LENAQTNSNFLNQTRIFNIENIKIPKPKQKTKKKIEDEILEEEEALLKELKEMKDMGYTTLTIPKSIDEPKKEKTHWDHLLNEMSWLAKDFKSENTLKIELARKISKKVLKYHQQKLNKIIKEEKVRF